MKSFYAKVALVGFFAILSACKSVGGSGSQVKDFATTERAQDIQDRVVDALMKDHRDQEGKLWSSSLGDISADWLIQSPENYWGLTARSFPINLSCTKGSASCDPVFLRKLCSTDDDCRESNSSCRVLEASLSPTSPARKMCLGSGDHLLDRYYRVIVSAEKHLEITSLSMPSGSFRAMVINALAVLHKKANPPSVRLLFSGPNVIDVNARNPAQSYLRNFWYEIGRAAGRTDAEMSAEDDRKGQRMAMNLAWLTDGLLSWNHSKIVIADQKHLIQGGHNLWDPDYTSDQPISDISMEAHGPIAKATQGFVNTLWSKVDSESIISRVGSWSYGELPQRVYAPLARGYRITPPDLQPGTGQVPMIAVGRLGKLGPNASDTAIIAMIKSSRSSLDFAIQDMYQSPVGGAVIALRPWILDALTDAILRGVRVRVVQSDMKASLNGYTMVNYQKAFDLLVSDTLAAANKRGMSSVNGQNVRDFVCKQVEYAPWRFTAGEKLWASGTGFGSHPKLFIVDDSAFYLGSHNFYPANLQEFGLVVADVATTRSLQEQHWNKLWEASQAEKARCN